MDISELLTELFGRIDEHVDEVLDGVDDAALTATVTEGSNPIGWLIWHLTRVQDHHVSELMSEPQEWVTNDWGGVFGIASDPDNTGYGHDSDEVASIRPSGAAALRDYYGAVWARTRTYLQTLSAGDLDRVVDERWDPPVTLGVRLVSVADDDIMHVGQAAYLRGLLG